MNRILSLCLGCLLALLLGRCGTLRNEVDPAFLNAETAKLVVNGFLSPQDTVLAIKLTRSQTVLGDSTGSVIYGDDVANATITIADGDQSVSLVYNKAQGYYQADIRRLPIIAGHTYQLRVRTPTGERAESRCTIPAGVQLTGITLDSTADIRINRFGNRRFYVTGRWKDPATVANFYQIRGVFQFIGNCPTCPDSVASGLEVILSNVRFDAGSIGLTTDLNADGTGLLSPRAYLTGWRNYVSNPDGAFNELFKMANIRIDLLNVEQAYYRYQDAIQQQAQVGGNPFAEPVLIPSNIQGALGCFAGYNRSTFSAKLK